MAEKEESGMLRVVVVVALIAIISLALIFGIFTLSHKSKAQTTQTATKAENAPTLVDDGQIPGANGQNADGSNGDSSDTNANTNTNGQGQATANQPSTQPKADEGQLLPAYQNTNGTTVPTPTGGMGAAGQDSATKGSSSGNTGSGNTGSTSTNQNTNANSSGNTNTSGSNAGNTNTSAGSTNQSSNNNTSAPAPTPVVNWATNVTDLEMDKALYNPGDKIHLTATVNQDQAKLQVQFIQDGQVVKQLNPQTTGQSISIDTTVPDGDNQQYLLKVSTLDNNGAITSTVNNAINVNTDPGKFPVMGFLSSYGADESSTLQNLKRLHVNYVQYYDWMNSNDIPVPNTNGQADANWTQAAKNPVSLQALQSDIATGKNLGMKSVAYGLMYGASGGIGEDGWTNADFLYKSANNQTTDNIMQTDLKSVAGGNMFKDNIYYLNYLSDSTKPKIWQKWKSVFAQVPFDGWHIDTLGDFGSSYTVDNSQMDGSFAAGVGYYYFVKQARDAFGPSVQLGVNAVGGFGSGAVANAGVNYLYSEQWPYEARSYNDLFQKALSLRQENPNLGLIIPAYIHQNTDWNGKTPQFDDNGVKMLNNVIMASGATHLEMGEHMLSREYFPNADISMSDSLKNYLPKQYDFMVAYHKQLSMTDTSSYSHLSIPVSQNVVTTDKVTAIEHSNDHMTSLSLLNTNGLNGDDWMDTNVNRNQGQAQQNVKLTFDKAFTHVYVATIENPNPVELGANPDGSYTIPEISNYTLVWGVN